MIFKKYWKLLTIFLISFALFYPSLFVFFTNDDFFFLRISNVKNLTDFLNFFNIFHNSDGFGMYRPLTTQVFYILANKVFNLNPLGLHVISFFVFFAVVFLVYKLCLELFKNEKMALISAFLYAASATHFAHLYYLATFQELGVTLFVILSCLAFLKEKKLLSLGYFILALLSKETGVITPFLIGLVFIYKDRTRLNKKTLSSLIKQIIPFAVCLLVYLFIRYFWYGFATGDSYVWNFSILKLVNTLFWYLLWALNIPESLVDFIGPGLVVNPNIFLYWSKEIVPILILFILQGSFIVWIIFKSIFNKTKDTISEVNKNSLLCIGWFLISLLPVIFLPIHKFTFYLTIPLIALVFRISYLLIVSKVNTIFITFFLLIWTLTSLFTLKFTIQTNWITQSEIIANKVFKFFEKSESNYIGKRIVFTDTDEDLNLPWSPTDTVKTALSENNFFEVFYPSLSKNVFYSGTGEIVIKSRQFIGY